MRTLLTGVEKQILTGPRAVQLGEDALCLRTEMDIGLAERTRHALMLHQARQGHIRASCFFIFYCTKDGHPWVQVCARALYPTYHPADAPIRECCTGEWG